jgi:drug/metabolite transporter (DMT)-like permease
MSNTEAPEQASTIGRFARFRNPALLGVLASVTSITAYGTGQIVTRSLVSGDTPPQVGAVIAFTAGATVLFFTAMSSLRQDIHAPKRGILWVVLAGLLASNGAFLSFFALARAPVVVITPIVGISPLLTLVLTAIFLRQTERITMRTVVGSIFVVSGVLLVIFGNTP